MWGGFEMMSGPQPRDLRALSLFADLPPEALERLSQR
jgi:hypothetical protein